MNTLIKAIILLSTLSLTSCLPYEDGKYHPEKYNIHDDGRYYRPPDEGKYIPGDEGRYTYVYTQGLYPDDNGDYRYVHQVGPDDNGDYRYRHQGGPDGGMGGNGGEGGWGPDGPNGPRGFGGPNTYDTYIGRLYAEKFPHLYRVIRAFINDYVSYENLQSEASSRQYSKVPNGGVNVKCKCLDRRDENVFSTDQIDLQMKTGEKIGTFYKFTGTKTLNNTSDTTNGQSKIEYEILVKVIVS